ncbi:C40 family peptidase [Paenibacillus sp. N3.4]|uniref:C40 family peptidase n=1 Tax=Paenibacillus sp. N3.4 TaxID=2603222 RepID=UPI0021C452E2|nr:C40 family peptidase [Paenibacillus sp. N3.4]
MKNQQKWYKQLVVAALVVSIGLSAGIVGSPHKAEAAVSSSVTANSIISVGKQYLGTPYQFGSNAGQTRTFDCSSFTQYVFNRNGISLPRSSKEQSHVGTYVSRSNLRPGDLVFFSIPSKPGVINHVAIYMGNGNILHTYGAAYVRPA